MMVDSEEIFVTCVKTEVEEPEEDDDNSTDPFALPCQTSNLRARRKCVYKEEDDSGSDWEVAGGRSKRGRKSGGSKSKSSKNSSSNPKRASKKSSSPSPSPKRKEGRRKRISEMTPEEHEEVKVKWREEARQRRQQKLTPTSIDVHADAENEVKVKDSAPKTASSSSRSRPFESNPEQVRAKWREETRRKRAMMSDEKREAIRERERERKRQQRAAMKSGNQDQISDEKKAEAAQRATIRRLMRQATMTEEEKQERKQKAYMRRLSLPEEELEARRKRERERMRQKADKRTPEEREKRRIERRERYRNMSPERRQKYLQSMRNYAKRKMEEAKQDPEKWEEVKAYWRKQREVREREAPSKRRRNWLLNETPEEHAARLKINKNLKERQRRLERRLDVQNELQSGLSMSSVMRRRENPSQRQRRLMQHRVRSAKRRMRNKLSARGAPPEQIEAQLAELEMTYVTSPDVRPYKPRRETMNHLAPSSEFGVLMDLKPSTSSQSQPIPGPGSNTTSSTIDPEIYSPVSEHHHPEAEAYSPESSHSVSRLSPSAEVNQAPPPQLDRWDHHKPSKAPALAPPRLNPHRSLFEQAHNWHESTSTAYHQHPAENVWEHPMDYSTNPSPPPPSEHQDDWVGHVDIDDDDDPAENKLNEGRGEPEYILPVPVPGRKIGPVEMRAPLTVEKRGRGRPRGPRQTRSLDDGNQQPRRRKGTNGLRQSRGPRGSVNGVAITVTAEELEKWHAELVPCDVCGNSYTRGAIRDHKRNQHNPYFKDNTCTVCNISVKKGREFLQHFKQAHATLLNKDPSKKRSFMCGHCGAAFTKLDYLTKHEYHCHGEGKNEENFKQCPICGRKFKRKITLNAHLRRAHPKESSEIVRTFECLRCPENFLHKEGLHEHVQSQHPDAFFPCQFCTVLRFSEKSLGFHYINCLKRPADFDKEWAASGKRAVSLERLPIKCEFCAKEIALFSMFRHYRDTHGVVEEMWQCSKCPKEFKSRMYFVNHLDAAHGVPIDDELLEMARKMNVKDREKVVIKNPEGSRVQKKKKEENRGGRKKRTKSDEKSAKASTSKKRGRRRKHESSEEEDEDEELQLSDSGDEETNVKAKQMEQNTGTGSPSPPTTAEEQGLNLERRKRLVISVKRLEEEVRDVCLNYGIVKVEPPELSFLRPS